MQDGFIANTTHGSTIHAVPACGRESGVAVYKGNQGGDGTGSMPDRKDSSDGNRGHQQFGSTSSRRASLAQSQDRGDDFESVTQGPRQTEWAPWPGVGAVFREYQMEQAQTVSAAQRAVERGDPIIGARRVSFCLAVRPGRTMPGSTPLSCPHHPAQVAVIVSTDPSTGPLRYWSEKNP
jgi:hypothetical protein